MRYQRTQVYLQPEAHRSLVEEARSRGLSLTGLLREIVTLHVRERVEAYRPKGLEAIIGVAGKGEPTNVAREQNELLGDALETRLEKKLGRKETDDRRLRSKGVRKRRAST